MISLKSLFKLKMPTLIGLFFFLLVNTVNAGYATLFNAKSSLYGFESNSCSYYSQVFSYQQIFSNSRYRELSIGGMVSLLDDSNMFQFQLDYGFLRGLTSTSKLSLSVLADNYVGGSSLYSSRLYIVLGLMRRLSERYSLRPSVSFPVLCVNQKSSFIVSFSVNYFYGSGIEYRETSDKLRRVRRKFLWFFWINDK